MNALQLLRTNLMIGLKHQIEKSREELRQQGHYASGRLDRSFEARVVGTAREVVLGQVLAEDYGEALDTGVRSDRIRYNPRVLLPWLRIVKKGLTDSQRLSMAFAIKNTHKKEGMPTRNAFSYSSNGKRTGWKQASIEAAQDRVDEALGLSQVVDGLISEAFEALVK